MHNIKSFIKNNQNILSIILVLIISLLYSGILLYINSTSNILGHSYRDIYFYLIEALRFSGYNITGYEYVHYLSPLIPFLTSILFKLGFVNEISLFIVTMLFYTLGVIGFYYLLKLRFNNLYSIFGSILYASLSINLMWAGNGSIDIPCVMLSIWALYFFIKAMNTNQKYFYIALPLCVLSFFAKYIGAVIFAIIILYFLSNNRILYNIKEYGKNIMGGLLVSIILTVPFFNFYITNHLPLGFINQAQEISSTTTNSAVAIHNHRGNNLLYYFINLPKFIYNPNHTISYILLIIAFIGILFAIYLFYKIIKTPNVSFKFFYNKINLPKYSPYILLAISILGMLISFLIAGSVSFAISEIIFFGSIFLFSLIFNKILEEYNKNNKYDTFAYDIAMIGWFMGHILFLSAHLTKVDRYAIAFAPPLVFFITYGMKTICDRIPNDYNIRELLVSIFIIIFLIMALGYLTIDKHDSLVDNEQKVVEWLELNNITLDSVNLASDRGPIYTWYLQKEVKYIVNMDNETFLSEQLIENNISYYISQEKNLTIPNYSKITGFGEVFIFERI